MEKIVFLGSSRLSQISLERLVTSEHYGKDFEIVALVSSLRFFRGALRALPQLANVSRVNAEHRNESALQRAIKSRLATLLFSVQHPWILSSEVIELVNGRCLNLHNARLPDYRGHNSISHSILNGEISYETTVHWMVSEPDAGATIYVEVVAVDESDTAMALYLRTLSSVSSLTDSLARDLAQGDIPVGKVRRGTSNYFPKNSLHGLRVLELSDKAEHIERVARAVFFPPHEPAFFLIRGGKFHLLPANSWDEGREPLLPANHATW